MAWCIKSNATYRKRGKLIDTGALVAVLKKGLYATVKRIFDKQDRQRVNMIRLFEHIHRLHFIYRELIFKVEPSYMYFIYQDKGYFCIALMSAMDKTILGGMAATGYSVSAQCPCKCFSNLHLKLCK
ncbi:hypothetical protein ACOSQ4_030863 [Xanthoceras sorbifolium]